MIHDFRIAVRSLWRARGMAFGVAGVLGLGIGWAAGIFSITRETIFPSEHYRHERELVRIGIVHPDFPNFEGPLYRGYFAAFRKLKPQAFDGLIAGSTRGEPVNLVSDDDPVPVYVAEVTANFFPVLGVDPAMGRNFLPNEETPGESDDAVILTDALWKSRFGSDPDIVGKDVRLKGRMRKIAGVLPPRFRVPAGIRADVFVPMPGPDLAPDMKELTAAVLAFARSRRVSADSIQAELRSRDLKHTVTNNPVVQKSEIVARPIASPLDFTRFRHLRSAQVTSFGAVALLFAISCLNSANLLSVRSLARRREMAVRGALGGHGLSLLKPLVLEGAILAVAAMILGTFIARWTFGTLVAAELDGNSDSPEFSWGALAVFAVIAGSLSVTVTTLAAWQSQKSDLTDSLKDGGAAGNSAKTRTVRTAFATAQLVLAVTLLAAAGLMVKSFAKIAASDPGFDVGNKIVVQFGIQAMNPVTTTRMTRGQNRTAEPPTPVRHQLREKIIDSLAHVPGVHAVGMASSVLPSGYTPWKIRVLGDGTESEEIACNSAGVSPNFLNILGLRTLRGQSLSEFRPSIRWIVVVNEAMAKKCFGGRDPIGARIKAMGFAEPFEVVGVVSDAKPKNAETMPAYYLPYWLVSPTADQALVQLAGPPGPQFSAELRRAVYRLDPTITVLWGRSLDEALNIDTGAERMTLRCLELLAALALVVAAAGIFATMAYVVQQREREFGVRLALGATPGQLQRLVMKQGMMICVIGTAIGIPLAIGSAKTFEALLFQTPASDPSVHAGVVFTLTAVTLAACLIPSRRALAADPTRLLRSE